MNVDGELMRSGEGACGKHKNHEEHRFLNFSEDTVSEVNQRAVSTRILKSISF